VTSKLKLTDIDQGIALRTPPEVSDKRLPKKPNTATFLTAAAFIVLIAAAAYVIHRTCAAACGPTVSWARDGNRRTEKAQEGSRKAPLRAHLIAPLTCENGEG